MFRSTIPHTTHTASHLHCYIQIQRHDLVYQEHESIKKTPDSDLNYRTLNLLMNFLIFEIDKQKKEDLNLTSSRSYECGEPMPRELASMTRIKELKQP